MALGKNIRSRRETLGWTLEKLSELSGVEIGTISALENRDSKRSQYATALARAMGVTLDELEQPDSLPPQPAKGTPQALLAGLSPAPERTGRVPLISWVQAGEWAHAADLLQPGEGYEWIDTSVAVQAHTFALRVEGDSMEPEFAPGTILVVEPELDAYPGDYVIAKNGDEATFKQLVRDGADLYLKPLNPRYPIKPLGSARVVGVVREAVKRYR